MAGAGYPTSNAVAGMSAFRYVASRPASVTGTAARPASADLGHAACGPELVCTRAGRSASASRMLLPVFGTVIVIATIPFFLAVFRSR